MYLQRIFAYAASLPEPETFHLCNTCNLIEQMTTADLSGKKIVS
jgi:hypothetical protein